MIETTLSWAPIYAAVCALLLVGLSIRVIRLRRAEKVSLGAGDAVGLQRAIRAQGNFSEYVPLVLILIGFAEIAGAPDWRLHVVGGLLLAGRASHAIGISRDPENYRWRTAGMAMTLGALISGAVTCLATVF